MCRRERLKSGGQKEVESYCMDISKEMDMTDSVFAGESLSLGGAFVLSEVGKQLLRIMKE